MIRKKNYPNIRKKLGAISFGRRLILLVVAVVPQFQLFANTSTTTNARFACALYLRPEGQSFTAHNLIKIF
ncbi:hypothetical protein P9079_06830 [Gallibacterium anatis]